MNYQLLDELNEMEMIFSKMLPIIKTVAEVKSSLDAVNVPNAVDYAKQKSGIPFTNTASGKYEYMMSKIGPEPAIPDLKDEKYMLPLVLGGLGTVIGLFIMFQLRGGLFSILFGVIIAIVSAIYAFNTYSTYNEDTQKHVNYLNEKHSLEREMDKYISRYQEKFTEYSRHKDQFENEASEKRKTYNAKLDELDASFKQLSNDLHSIASRIGLPTQYKDNVEFVGKIRNIVAQGRADSIKEAINIKFQDDNMALQLRNTQEAARYAQQTAQDTQRAMIEARIEAERQTQILQERNELLQEQRNQQNEFFQGQQRLLQEQNTLIQAQRNQQNERNAELREAGRRQCQTCQSTTCPSSVMAVNQGNCARYVPSGSWW